MTEGVTLPPDAGSARSSGTVTGGAASGRVMMMIVCGAAIVSIAMGLRQSFGLLLPEMGVALGISRSGFGLALAVQNLVFGLVQPFVGAIADRHGAGRVVLAGALLYAVGLAVTALAGSLLGVEIGLGLLVGLALSGTTFVVILGAVGRVVPRERRGAAFGIVTAGGSLGQFLLVPATQMVLGSLGYRETLLIMAGFVVLCGVLAIGVAGRPAAGGAAEAEDGEQQAQSLGTALHQACHHRGYWLINVGFFVCGFHVAFILTHFPAYLNDKGLGLAVGGQVLALIGLANIFGSIIFGRAGDWLREKYVLSGLYAARAVVIALFLLAPLSQASALIFAAGMGLLWLGTVPLTSNLVGRIFGMRHLGMLYGIAFMNHQIGSFFGAWFAGLLFDRSGSYDVAWAISIGLGLLAALVNLPVKDVPLIGARGSA